MRCVNFGRQAPQELRHIILDTRMYLLSSLHRPNRVEWNPKGHMQASCARKGIGFPLRSRGTRLQLKPVVAVPASNFRKSIRPIRLFLADVDGALVTSDKVLTDRAVQADHELHTAGVLFAVTSGRPPSA
ncbi:HAD hydrolase family protein [Streptomyces sp. NPDC007157]|uniref:HAD family hydrolase n=1 Tax=Streptomyces sp. NPDC007157 TaxID=3154681 RepID=UPI0033F7C8AB